MARTAQPTVKRVLLGRELAHARALAKLPQGAVAKAIGKSQDMIARLEDGLATIKADLLESLMGAVGITDEDHRDIVRAMHADSHKTIGWNTGYRRVYHEDLRLLIDLEEHAEHIFISQVEIIPGLLQHPEYTRWLAQQGVESESFTMDDVIEAWQARQKILTKKPAPTVHVLLSESCVARRFGPDDVMVAQMEYLELLATRHRNLLLQVLPFDSGYEHFIGAVQRFQMLRVPSKGHAGHLRMVYDEGLGEIRYRDDPRVLAEHDDWKNQAAAAALNADASRRFIRDVARSFAKA